MDIIHGVGDLFESLFKQGHFVAVIVGWMLSTGLTQLAKYPIRLWFFSMGKDPESPLTPDISQQAHRWTVRFIAVIGGALAAFFTWPPGDGMQARVVWAIATGLACPTLYQVVTHFFPWLADAASADKVLPPGKS